MHRAFWGRCPDSPGFVYVGVASLVYESRALTAHALLKVHIEDLLWFSCASHTLVTISSSNLSSPSLSPSLLWTAGQGSLTVPGCVAATPVVEPIHVEEGYPLEIPLVYFFGHASPGDNPDYYTVRPWQHPW